MSGEMDIKRIFIGMPLNFDDTVAQQDGIGPITEETDASTAIPYTEDDDLVELDFFSISDGTTISDADAIRDYINSNLSFNDRELILKESNGFFNISSLQIKDNELESISTKDGKNISFQILKNPDLAQQDSIEETISSPEGTVVPADADINAESPQAENLSQSQSETDVTNNDSIENPTETNPENTGSEVITVENIDGQNEQTDNPYTSDSDNILNQTNIFEGQVSDYGNLSPLESSDSQLSSLIQERSDAVEDLTQQQTEYQQTQDEANEVLGQIDSDIQTQQANLEGAQADKQDAEETLTQAQDVAQQAEEDLNVAAETKDETKDVLDCAVQETQDATQIKDDAAADNQEAIACEQAADEDYSSACSDLSDATDTVSSKAADKEVTGANLASEVSKTKTAFNVKNQKQAQVAKAQKEYNSAISKKGDESWWKKFCNWVSSLKNKLSDAIAGRDHAQAELERQQEEEEKARVVDEEAIEALEKAQDEQDVAQKVADAAQVVLDRATNAREVTDQEYADALLTLANAMGEQENAEEHYNGALDNFMAAKGYKTDADGNVTDAKGEVVSCSQICSELETFVSGLQENRETTSNSYDLAIKATVDAINGDNQKIDALSDEIETLRNNIAQKEAQLALQEEMIAALDNEQAQILADENGGGIADSLTSAFGGGSKANQKELDTKKELLNKAIKNGDTEAIQEAYKEIYGDTDVTMLNGAVVDPSKLSETELKKATTCKLSELEGKELTDALSVAQNRAGESKRTLEALNSGQFVVDGKVISKDDIIASILSQAEDLQNDMDTQASAQGWLSKAIGGANNVLGIGTSEQEARSQVTSYQQLAQQLANCNDPAQFAAIYKQVTGNNFDVGQIINNVTYNELKGVKTENKTVTDEDIKNNHLSDITDYKNDTISALETNELDYKALSNASNSKAAQSIEKYVETQNSATDAVCGVVSGVAAAAAVALGTVAGICAAPFTAGASLGLVAAGFAVAAGTGAAVNTLLKSTNSIYDADGNGTLEFNYSGVDFAKDMLAGAANGAIGNLANGAGSYVTKGIGSFADDAIATTLKQSAKRAVINNAAQLAGAAVEGSIDGGISAGANYALEAAFNEDVDFDGMQMLQAMKTGAEVGAVFNVGMKSVGMVGSSIKGKVDSAKFADAINEVLDGGTTDNKLANMVAGKLDDSLIDDGVVNKYAVKQLMNNAKTSFNALRSAGLDEESALKFLDNTTIDMQKSLDNTINTITRNYDKMEGIDEILPSKGGRAELLNNLDMDSMKFDDSGNLVKVSSTLPDGTKIYLDFDAKGRLLNNEFISAAGDDLTVSSKPLRAKVDALRKAGVLTDKNSDFYIDNWAKEGSLKARDKVNFLARQDIDTLYKAQIDGVDLSDPAQVQKLFVKAFDSADDAIGKLKAGDICTIGDSGKVSIKLTDGTLKELDFSPEKYMELFPPVQRFAFSQGRIGDCWLVSSLDSLNKNPAGRVHLLSCIKEVDDGVEFDLPGGEVKFKLENGKKVSDYIGDSFKDKGKIIQGTPESMVIKGPEGIQGLEYAVGLNLFEIQSKALQANLDSCVDKLQYFDEISEIVDKFHSSNGAMSLKDLKTELMGKADISRDSNVTYFINCLDPDDEFTLRALEANIRANRARVETLDIPEAQKAIVDLGDVLNGAQTARNGGWSVTTYTLLGLEDTQLLDINNPGTKELLTNPDKWEGKIFNLGSKHKENMTDQNFMNIDYKIAYGHEYSLRPMQIDGEIVYKVNNPWNTADTLILTLDDLDKYFDILEFATV